MDDLNFEDTSALRKGRRRVVLLVASIPLAAVLLSLGIAGASYWRLKAGASSLPQNIKKARAAGLAINAAELGEAPKDLPKYLDIALSEYRKRNIAYGTPGIAFYDSKGVFCGPGLEPAIKALTPAMEALEKHLQTEPASFVIDRDQGPGAPRNALDIFDVLSKAFCVRGYSEIQKGDWDKGIHDLEVVAQIADRIIQIKSFDAENAATLCLNDRLFVVLTLAKSKAISTDNGKLLRLKKLVSDSKKILDPKECVRGEIFSNLAVLRNYELLKDTVTGGPTPVYSSSSSAMGVATSVPAASISSPYTHINLDPKIVELLDRNEIPKDLRNQTIMSRYLAYVLPYWERFKNDRKSWVKLADDWNISAGPLFSSGNPLDQIIARLGNPFWAASSALVMQAKLAASEAMIGAMIFRNDNNRWPSNIGELKTSYVDPFTLKSLSIADRLGHFRIYSVGPNLKDDGGFTQIEVHAGKGAGDDVVIVFPPSAMP